MPPGRSRRVAPQWLAVTFLVVGLFGATVAVSGLWAPLPPPKAGGTCGPGLGSEAAIKAMLNPGSIGAGAEPPASRASARAQWKQFVDECQTAADTRAAVTLPLLVVSAGMVVAGLVLLWRRLEHDGAKAAPPQTPLHDAWWPAPPGRPAGTPSGAPQPFGPQPVGPVGPPGATTPWPPGRP